MSNTIGVIVVSVGLIVIVVLAILFGTSLFSTVNHSTTQISQTSSNAHPLPIRFTFMNLYSNPPQPIPASIMATIFKGALQVDSGVSSNGVWLTTKSDFKSGDSYSLYAVSGNAKYEFSFQVPNVSNSSQSSFPITLNMALIGSYSVGVLAPDGQTAITSSYNSTSGICNGATQCKAMKPPTFTIVISNSVDNTGITGTFQRTEIQGRTLTANAIIVTTTNTAKSKIYIMPDHATDKTRNPDGTLNLQGQYSQQITIDTSSLLAGNAGTVNFQYVCFIDSAYFNASNGV